MRVNPKEVYASGEIEDQRTKGAKIMEFSPAERSYFEDRRMLSTDSEGREVFRGLTLEESGEFWGFLRDGVMEIAVPQERDRYLDLYVKHEKARLQIIMAEIEAEQDPVPN
jgi:hypothetical protein